MTPRYPPDPEHAFREVPEDDKEEYWRWFSTGSVALDFLRAVGVETANSGLLAFFLMQAITIKIDYGYSEPYGRTVAPAA